MLTPAEIVEYHATLNAAIKGIRNIGALKEVMRAELDMLDRKLERTEVNADLADYLESCKQLVVERLESLEEFSDDQDLLRAPWEIDDLEVLRRAYEKTKNPLYVWQAIALDIAPGEEFPYWVRKYLVCSGKDLLQVAFDIVLEGAKIKNPASEVAKALRFQRGGKYFSQYANTKSHWLFLGEEVEKLVGEGDKPYIARERVAKRHKLSSSTVRLASLQYQKVVEGRKVS